MPNERELWNGFCAELESRNTQLAGEFSNAWRDLASLAASLRETVVSFEAPAPEQRLSSLDALFDEAAKRLLFDPLAAHQQRRPMQRTLSAVQEHESLVGDLLRRLPRSIELSGRSLAEMVADRVSTPWLARRRSWQRAPKAVALRDTVSDHLERAILERATLDGWFQLLLAVTSLHLLEPWQRHRRVLLATLARGGRPDVDVEGERRWRAETARRRDEQATGILTGCRVWAEAFPSRLSRALLRRPAPSSQRKRNKWQEEHQRHMSFWSRQQRAVQSVLELEMQLARLGREAARETAHSLQAVDVEHRELIEELGGAIEWLRNWTEGVTFETFPPPRARLSSSDERVSEWQRRLFACARMSLPMTVETVEPKRILPGIARPWRDLEPVKVFQRSLDHAGSPVLLGGFREVEGVHRAVVREIERAREVVGFGFEVARSEGAAGQQLAREAVNNALSLLEYQRRAAPESHPGVEESAVRAGAATLLECQVALEKGRVGFLAHVTRQRGGEALRQFRDLAVEGVRFVSRHIWAGARFTYRWALLKIGWAAAPLPAAEPVVRRMHLGETLDLQLHFRDLPMIYRRLFRLVPVEDPRFLVGREAELAGFAEALARWENGRDAAVIVVGARGSGKTSLINCAISGVLSQQRIVSGQFSDRVTSIEQMQAFLRRLFGLAADRDLIAGLRETRRVAVIEEFERTFLCVMNGFDPLRHLLDLMYATGGSTLWVFSVNETAYKYLDAVLGLGRHFSHRINAMSVRQEDLTNAILQRHNLSGLRLEFAPLPEEDPRVSKMRRLLGFEHDARRLFLDALYEQSEGIFRSAFELWQGSIERVEGGVVHMRQPLAPDYRPLMAELTLEDYFTLKAILQHGSMTEHEVAQVFGVPPESSRRQMERLQLLEILEPEPASPGLRVRPEAGRIVREALDRHNLL